MYAVTGRMLLAAMAVSRYCASSTSRWAVSDDSKRARNMTSSHHMKKIDEKMAAENRRP